MEVSALKSMELPIVSSVGFGNDSSERTMSAFVFMVGNARPHRANIVSDCLQPEDITRMEWSGFSPDFNPIEHVWEILRRRIAAHKLPPFCVPELWKALLLCEWSRDGDLRPINRKIDLLDQKIDMQH
ncbi:transposable element Tcb1 transposase [Trichonephila clavipes]|nr:transposable element Tcb1 transposase [Trichonephila clavipes]